MTRAAIFFTLIITILLMPSARHAGADSACWRYRKSERALQSLTNKVRARRSLARLDADPELSKVARVHAAEMARTGYPWHSNQRMLDRRVTNWKILGENVGVGRNIQKIHGAFMRSRTHRENIVFGRWRRIGLGVVEVRGRLWVTVMFATERNPGTTLRMPRC